jgi:PPM family protein phosphatase
MNVRIGASSDIGKARERNEDSFLVRRPLFAVADGMGGHRGGDVASSLALETLQGLKAPGDPSEVMPALVEEVRRANRRVLEKGEGDRNLRGMGTTLTALWSDGEKAYLAHVGDSRAYLLRDGTLQQLTEDHTLVQRYVREGRITPKEAGRHPQRSILTRALGVEEELPVDELTLDVLAGDRVLLCTDGLTSMIEEGQIQKILTTEQDPQAACNRLVEAANAAGGDDNITVILLDFVEGDGSNGGGEDTAAATGAPAPPQTSEGGGDRLRRQKATAPEAEAPPPRRRIRWRRVAVWGVIAIALLAAGWLALRIYVDHQWYVGESNGRVAISNGIPSTVLGRHLSHDEQTTDISSTSAEQLQPWQGLQDGITAKSLAGARNLIAQIRTDVSRASGATG